MGCGSIVYVEIFYVNGNKILRSESSCVNASVKTAYAAV